jgi:hypothetical protein
MLVGTFLAVTFGGPVIPASADTITQGNGTALCAHNWMGQTFVPQNDGPLTSIAVTFAFRGTGTGSARMRIYNNSSRNTLLATSTNDVSDPSTGEFSYVNAVFSFNSGDVNFVSGTTYYFEVQTVTGTVFYLWSDYRNTPTDLYSGGRLFEGSGGCASTSVNWDAKFVITFTGGTTTTSTTTTTTTVAPTTTTTTSTTSTTTTTTTVAPTTTTTTTTTVAPTTTSTTTTAAPTTTVVLPGSTTTVATTTTNPVVVASSGSTTTTVARKATTPISVVPQATTTSPSSSTTSTTSTTTSLPAPDAAPADPGEASVMVNGVATTMSITRFSNSYRISGSGIGMTLQVLDSDGEVVPLDSEGNITGSDGDSVVVEVTGALPDASLNVWMFSTPIQIGSGDISQDGDFTGKFALPKNIVGGSHRLVLNTLSYSGSDSTVSVGFIVRSSDNGNVSIGTIIFTTLGLAIAFALIIPATRRRRRKVQEV